MMRDITLGQYYPVQSPVHKLDPRTKLFGTLVLVIALFVADNVYCYGAAALFLFGIIAASKVPVRHIVKGLKPVLFLLVFSAAFNLFLTPGEELVHFWIFTITKEGLVRAGMMAVRLTFLVMGTSLLTFTTTPNQLTDGLERSLRFLNVVHVPVHEIAMIMSIALRFIPILVEETDKIMKAQMARGADFETGGLIKKAKAMIPLLVPLFISAFRRASDLALAMEARCYHGGEGRTKMKPLKYRTADRLAYLILLAFPTGVVLLRVLL